jgi:hypothetical protein
MAERGKWRPLAAVITLVCVAALSVHESALPTGSSRRRSRPLAKDKSSCKDCTAGLKAASVIATPSSTDTNSSFSRKGPKIDPPAPVPVPVLSVSLTEDHKGYLLRLLASIDYPVSRILVQIGNPDAAVDRAISTQINALIESKPKFLAGHVHIKHIKHNPGCAHGWNLGLRAIQNDDDDSWAFVANSDLAFQPGSLEKLARHMRENLRDDSRFIIGFTNRQHHIWSGFAATRRLVQKVGLFDENFYPIYFEDDDMANRIMRAGLVGKQFMDVQTIHGDDATAASFAYRSGTLEALANKNASTVSPWAEMVGRVGLGRPVSAGAAGVEYYTRKWGTAKYSAEWGFSCKDITKPCAMDANGLHHTPFNDPTKPLSYWKIEPHRRAYIVTGRGALQQALEEDRTVAFRPAESR